MHLIKVDDVVPGQTIASDVVNFQGKVILPAGTVVGPRHRTLFKAWGIVEIPVQDAAVIAASPEAAKAGADPVSAPALPPAIDEKTHPVLVELAAITARLAPKSEPAAEVSAPPAKDSPAGRKGNHSSWVPITPETVAGHARTLVSLPTIYFHVDKAINHPSSSSADIANVLRSDQGLSTRLLRIANSAFYGFPRRVENVDQAIRIIGTRQLHDLVLATVVLTQFRGVDARFVSMASFWKHSFACGIAARSLATLCRESNSERFFVAGLLHDIGSLVLYQEFSERSQAALEQHQRDKTPLDEVERAVVGCDHGQVGAALMTIWKLPEFYRETTAHHHNPNGRAPSAGTSLIHLADLMVSALALGSNGEIGLPRFCVDAWDLVGLSPSCLGRIAEDVLGLVDEAVRVFMKE
jgi:HD-like signal output (HDOD) protein